MPCRVEPGNLPVGMQIGAASNRDLPLLAFARAYEVRLFDHHWPT
jgi:Asp-tRNA(Asn)/Glu-tRNA(Gln) amidotransferase A subunit family amidase